MSELLKAGEKAPDFTLSSHAAAAGDAEDGGPGTDFHAVMQGYVSITPLQLDRTFSDAFSGLDGWLEGLR